MNTHTRTLTRTLTHSHTHTLMHTHTHTHSLTHTHTHIHTLTVWYHFNILKFEVLTKMNFTTSTRLHDVTSHQTVIIILILPYHLHRDLQVHHFCLAFCGIVRALSRAAAVHGLSHHPWIHQPNISRRVKSVKLVLIWFSPTSCPDVLLSILLFHSGDKSRFTSK